MELSKKSTKNIPKPTHFGKNLKFLRRLNGLSQTALAEKVNMKRNNIASYESGVVEPNAIKYLLISEYFKVDPREMLNTIFSERPSEIAAGNIIEPLGPELGQYLIDQIDQFVIQTNEMTKVYEGYKAFFEMKKENDASTINNDLYLTLNNLLELLKSLIQSNWNMIQSVYNTEEE